MRLSRFSLILLALLILAVSFTPTQAGPPPPQPTSPAHPLAPLACDPDGVQDSGAIYRICMPIIWNGDLLIFAHGYVSPTRPVGIPEEQMTLPGGLSLGTIANTLGLAFATTSYSTNGLAVRQGVADIVDLVDIFEAEKGAPDHVIVLGGSEGGLIAALLIEQHPEIFAGGLAMCGPYGSFRRQINYFGDFRVLFDYFFPGLLPGSPTDVPDWLLNDWDTYYDEGIRPALHAPDNASRVDQLLTVAGAAYDPTEPDTKFQTIEQLLWYNVFATNDGRQKLGGQPFDNQGRRYAGSHDDATLNAGVQRFTADQAALDEMAAHYETRGRLSVPLVTLHTTADPLIPAWHAVDYQGKVILADNIALHDHVEIERYGHCNFRPDEVLQAFERLGDMINEPPAYQPVHRQFLPFTALNAQF